MRRDKHRQTLRTVGAGAAWLGWVLCVLIIVQSVSGLVQQSFGRSARMVRVAEIGLSVAHPEYAFRGGGCCGSSIFWMSTGVLEFDALSPVPVPALVNPDVRQNLFGRVDGSTARLPETPLARAIWGGPIPRGMSARILDGLPRGTVASAVVFFAHPLDQAALSAFKRTWSIAPWQPILFASGYRPVGWQGMPADEDFAEPTIPAFQRWVETLGDSDNQSLLALGLPNVSRLRALATGGSVGVTLGVARVSTLRRMLDDPAVASVSMGEAAPDLGHYEGGYDTAV